MKRCAYLGHKMCIFSSTSDSMLLLIIKVPINIEIQPVLNIVLKQFVQSKSSSTILKEFLETLYVITCSIQNVQDILQTLLSCTYTWKFRYIIVLFISLRILALLNSNFVLVKEDVHNYRNFLCSFFLEGGGCACTKLLCVIKEGGWSTY